MAHTDQRHALKDIVNPHQNDVLYGRGGGTNNHFGNSQWRSIISKNKKRYIRLPKRKKMLLAQSIVLDIRQKDPPGRFLQRDPKSKLWYDVGDQKARDKTSQALREGAKDIRNEMINEDSDQSDDDLVEKKLSKLSPDHKPSNKGKSAEAPSPSSSASTTKPVAAACPPCHPGPDTVTSSTSSSARAPVKKTQKQKAHPILPQSSEQCSTLQEPKKEPVSLPPPAAIPPSCPPIMKPIPISAIASMQSAKMKGMKIPTPFNIMSGPFPPSSMSSSSGVMRQVSSTSTSSTSKVMAQPAPPPTVMSSPAQPSTVTPPPVPPTLTSTVTPPTVPPTITTKAKPMPELPTITSKATPLPEPLTIKSTPSINNNVIENGNQQQFFVPRIPPQRPFSKDSEQMLVNKDFSQHATKAASVSDATPETATETMITKAETTTTKKSDESSLASNVTNQTTPATAPPYPTATTATTTTTTTTTARASKMISFNSQFLSTTGDESSLYSSTSRDVTTEKLVAPRALPSQPLSKNMELSLIHDDFVEPIYEASISSSSSYVQFARTCSASTSNTISTVSTGSSKRNKGNQINFTITTDIVDINRMITQDCPFSDSNQEFTATLKAVRTSLLDEDLEDVCNSDGSIFGNQSFPGEDNFIATSAATKKGRMAVGTTATTTGVERTISITMSDILSLDSMDLARNESRGGQAHATIDSTNIHIKEIVKTAMRETRLGRGQSEAISEMSCTGLSRDCSMDMTGLSRGNSLASADYLPLLSRGNSLALADVTVLSRGNSSVPKEVLQRWAGDVSVLGTAASNTGGGTGVADGNINHHLAPMMSNAGGTCDPSRKTATMTTFSTNADKTSSVSSHGPNGDVPSYPAKTTPPLPQRPPIPTVDKTPSSRGTNPPGVPTVDETSLGQGVSFAFSDISGVMGETNATEATGDCPEGDLLPPPGKIPSMDEMSLGRGISTAFSDFSDAY